MTTYPPGRVDVTVTDLGTLHMVYTDNWATGTTTYTVKGPRITGSFVACLDFSGVASADLDPDTTHVFLELGTGSEHFNMHKRDDRPVINGVDLMGRIHVYTHELRQRRLTGRNIWISRPVGDYHSQQAPDATQARTAAVAGAIVRHWITRPDAHLLHLAAVAYETRKPVRLYEQNRIIEHQQAVIDEATATRDAAAAELDALATMRGMFATAPAFGHRTAAGDEATNHTQTVV